MSRAREKRDDFDRMLKRIHKEFPKEPEAQLCHAVVEQAIRDLFYPGNASQEKREVQQSWEQAVDYLSGEIPHASVWGVEADWIRHFIFVLRVKYDTCTESGRQYNSRRSEAKARQGRLLAQAMGDAGQKRPAATGLS